MNTYYAIIDNIKNGDSFIDIFPFESEAINRAEYELSIMSNYDKNHREEYAVYMGYLDDDGCFDLNTAELLMKYI